MHINYACRLFAWRPDMPSLGVAPIIIAPSRLRSELEFSWTATLGQSYRHAGRWNQPQLLLLQRTWGVMVAVCRPALISFSIFWRVVGMDAGMYVSARGCCYRNGWGCMRIGLELSSSKSALPVVSLERTVWGTDDIYISQPTRFIFPNQLRPTAMSRSNSPVVPDLTGKVAIITG